MEIRKVSGSEALDNYVLQALRRSPASWRAVAGCGRLWTPGDARGRLLLPVGRQEAFERWILSCLSWASGFPRLYLMHVLTCRYEPVPSHSVPHGAFDPSRGFVVLDVTCGCSGPRRYRTFSRGCSASIAEQHARQHYTRLSINRGLAHSLISSLAISREKNSMRK
jgi:hypothetical protein